MISRAGPALSASGNYEADAKIFASASFISIFLLRSYLSIYFQMSRAHAPVQSESIDKFQCLQFKRYRVTSNRAVCVIFINQ